MVDYAKLRGTSRRLIGNNGRPMTLVTKGAAVDPARPWDGTSAEGGSSIGVTGISTIVNRRDVGGTKVQRNDKLVIISSTADDGSLLDDSIMNNSLRVTDGGSFQVAGVEPIKPGPLVLGYRLLLRS